MEREIKMVAGANSVLINPISGEIKATFFLNIWPRKKP